MKQGWNVQGLRLFPVRWLSCRHGKAIWEEQSPKGQLTFWQHGASMDIQNELKWGAPVIQGTMSKRLIQINNDVIPGYITMNHLWQNATFVWFFVTILVRPRGRMLDWEKYVTSASSYFLLMSGSLKFSLPSHRAQTSHHHRLLNGKFLGLYFREIFVVMVLKMRQNR